MMLQRSDRIALLKRSLDEKILILDGGMGTSFQNRNLGPDDFGGEELEGLNEYLVKTRPELVSEIHEEFLEAGADIIETNTFGGTPLVLDEYKKGSECYELNYLAAKLALDCAEKWTNKTPTKPRFVAGSIGPTVKALSVTGGVTFDELQGHFYQQVLPLFEAGVDFFLIETCQDTRNIKACLLAISQLFKEKEEIIPIAVSGTIEPMGTMLAGQEVEALVNSLEHIDCLYIGLNCATGPEFMRSHLRTISNMANTHIACVPNAGLPDDEGIYLETPQMMCEVLGSFIEEGLVNILGGCCGTTPEHIKAFSKLVEGKATRKFENKFVAALSGIEYLTIEDDNRPLIVGERTNVIGSRKFKDLITDEKFEEASEIAKAQVKNGAQIIDICLSNPDREEIDDIKKFLEQVIKKIKVPLMIDSTDTAVIKEALKYSQGKAIINSINLEEGEQRFKEIIPLGNEFGAAYVVGTIDDDPQAGMGVSRERKLEIATVSYDLLTKKYGVKDHDIFWDPLVFPCATGDENYVGSAIETIEGIRLIKEKYPKTKTVLGISNVSFGLPAAGREVLNSVFLYHCTKAGLDLALVNSQKIKRFSSISPEELKLSEDLIWNRGSDPIQAFTDFFRGKKVEKIERKLLPLEERLPNYILEGSKDGLIADLNLMLEKLKPLAIINGPLMDGMNIVGKLFNENKLIVAEVLQSAEAMKAAVSHLESFMESKESSVKGKIILATVKGDVHDIGKNLVEIILSNNGFEVINLGIKIPSNKIIEAVREHKPDIIGLSGLLVKSAQQMVLTANDLMASGINTPILVGGAALSAKFVSKKVSAAYEGLVVYSKDAMQGLTHANKVINEEGLEELRKDAKEQINRFMNEEAQKKGPIFERTKNRSSSINVQTNIPIPLDFKRHILKKIGIEEVFLYLNPLMLYGRHLGVKGKYVKLLADKKFAELKESDEGSKALKIYQQVQDIFLEYKNTHLFPQAVYQFFPVLSEGNKVIFYHSEKPNIDEKTYELEFIRQAKEDGICLSDYISPKKDILKDEKGKEAFDNLCLFTVTVGSGVREEAERLKEKGEYLKSHILSSLALELAESLAEYLHTKIRSQWGQRDPPDMTMMDRFQAKYEGKRYSFGYPACPELEDQKVLFDLLQPNESIGVELTENYMMDPEASVSAICFSHPQAKYFSVGAGEMSAN